MTHPPDCDQNSHSFPVMLNTVIITKENDYLKIEFKQINVFIKRQSANRYHQVNH